MLIKIQKGFNGPTVRADGDADSWKKAGVKKSRVRVPLTYDFDVLISFEQIIKFFLSGVR